MSFNNKPNRPDSKETAKLRKEYEDLARQTRETKDPLSRIDLHDRKNKAFDRVKDNIIGERRQNLAEMHKVLINQGKLMSKEEYAKELARSKEAATSHKK